MLVFLHEMLLKVSTPLIWSLKPYSLAVPSSLIQNSSLVLRSEVSRVGFSNYVTPTNYISSEREFIGESESFKISGKYFEFAIL